jgi:hypothetical protein
LFFAAIVQPLDSFLVEFDASNQSNSLFVTIEQRNSDRLMSAARLGRLIGRLGQVGITNVS